MRRIWLLTRSFTKINFKGELRGRRKFARFVICHEYSPFVVVHLKESFHKNQLQTCGAGVLKLVHCLLGTLGPTDL